MPAGDIEAVRKLPRGESGPHSTADIHERMCSNSCSAKADFNVNFVSQLSARQLTLSSLEWH